LATGQGSLVAADDEHDRDRNTSEQGQGKNGKKGGKNRKR
jgi:hypothetical protein